MKAIVVPAAAQRVLFGGDPMAGMSMGYLPRGSIFLEYDATTLCNVFLTFKRHYYPLKCWEPFT
jgi:hypothetical protein